MSHFYAEISEFRVHIWFCFKPAENAEEFLNSTTREGIFSKDISSLKEGSIILKDWCDDWILDNSWVNALGDVCGSWQIYKGINKDYNV